MSVTHSKVSGIADGGDTSLVQPSDWNAAHTVSLTASDVGAVPTTRTLTAGTGLSGGGDLSSNRSFAVTFPSATIRQAAGVPSGAPTGTELPIAFDSTATTGGLYVWSGSAWVLAAPIPPVITPS